jgi:hypothetical protein
MHNLAPLLVFTGREFVSLRSTRKMTDARQLLNSQAICDLADGQRCCIATQYGYGMRMPGSCYSTRVLLEVKVQHRHSTVHHTSVFWILTKSLPPGIARSLQSISRMNRYPGRRRSRRMQAHARSGELPSLEESSSTLNLEKRLR